MGGSAMMPKKRIVDFRSRPRIGGIAHHKAEPSVTLDTGRLNPAYLGTNLVVLTHFSVDPF